MNDQHWQKSQYFLVDHKIFLWSCGKLFPQPTYQKIFFLSFGEIFYTPPIKIFSCGLVVKFFHTPPTTIIEIEKKRRTVLPNTAHLNNLRKKTRGGWCSQTRLIWINRERKQRWVVLPNMTNLNDWSKKNRGGGCSHTWPQNTTTKISGSIILTRGRGCSQTWPNWINGERKKRGTVLPNTAHLNDLRKKTRGGGAPKHDLFE